MKRNLLLLACSLFLLLPAQARVTVTAGSTADTYLFKGEIVTPSGVMNGEMVVEGDTITCVEMDCTDPEGATRITVSSAYIYPGFIDAHNHVAYNVFPKWTPPKLYENRGQWQRSKAYRDFKAPYNDLKSTVFCEMVKYGEIKALISGITTIQGTAPKRKCFKTLIRNAENYNELGFPSSHVRTYILDISSFSSSIDWTKTKAFVVHLAEGIDERSRKEFDTLKDKNLLHANTVIIHGTAFGNAEFQAMKNVGAKLVWSPQSNLVLYGKTTNIPLALQNNILISLGVDWNPTGSDTLFKELRIAAEVNEQEFNNAITNDMWLKLITENPAKALALDAHIGSLTKDRKADITIVRKRADDPNSSLLQNRLQDVQFVMVSGKALYGNEAGMNKLHNNGCEPLIVHGSRKKICVPDDIDPVDGSDQTLAQIRTILQDKYPQLAPLAP
ncbi:MAG: amidohydrolase family protein [Gammaproteobacteria bacterium]